MRDKGQVKKDLFHFSLVPYLLSLSAISQTRIRRIFPERENSADL